MINKIVIYALFSLSMLAPAMDEGPKDVNAALLLATINGKIGKKALSHIDNLLTLGADPNYASPIFKVTPLMRAVRVNCPGLVQLLLQRNAQVNDCNSDDRCVRDFNIMYSKKKIEPIVTFITNCMLKIEKYNALHPKKKIDCWGVIYFMKSSRIIRNAVRIDKMLEDRTAKSDVLGSKHPFLRVLKNSHVKRAMSYVLAYSQHYLPCDIRNSMR